MIHTTTTRKPTTNTLTAVLNNTPNPTDPTLITSQIQHAATRTWNRTRPTTPTTFTFNNTTLTVTPTPNPTDPGHITLTITH